MSQDKDRNIHFGNVRKKLGVNLMINWLIPIVLVILLRRLFVSDTTALAIAGIIPAIRTIALLFIRRRIDWLGVLSVIGFVMAYSISVITGGSALPLKLYHPVVTGIIGLVLLSSAIIRKPLLEYLIKIFKHTSAAELSNPIRLKKITIITAVIGAVFLCDAAAHIIMALSVSTETYLIMSRVITFLMIAALLGLRWLVPRINK